MIPVALFARVSTDKQATDRQLHELREVAARNGWQIVAEITEVISGAKSQDCRDGLNRVLALAQSGKIRKVLVHEISRLARRNSVAHAALETLHEHGVGLYWFQQGVCTLLDNGKVNPAAALMFALLAEMARAERSTLVDRINSGLAEARRKGVKLGRPAGYRVNRLESYREVVAELRDGRLKLPEIAQLKHVSLATVRRIKRDLEVVS